MFSNYFKIALRNLNQDRQFTLLNLMGLATGLACTLFIVLWVLDEYRVGRYHEKQDNLYQILTNSKSNDDIVTGEYTAGLLAKAIKEGIPEIEYAASVLPASWFSSQGLLTIGDKKIKARGEYVSQDYFDVFTCPFLVGDKKSLFEHKQSVAISEGLAVKIFGSTDHVTGKTFQWNQDEFSGSFTISGVFADIPVHALNKYDLLFNFDWVLDRRPNLLNFSNSDPHTYVILRKDADVATVAHKINDVLRTHDPKTGNDLFLARYADKYLYGSYKHGLQSGGRITYVRLFSFIALFILVLACINFMNLATAKASRRFKEVGVRKVVGASRSKLIVQHLVESGIMSGLAFVLAGILVFSFLPAFNSITGKQLEVMMNGQIILSSLAIVLITGLLAGSYPAFYLSGFNPVGILKGINTGSLGEYFLRRGLVIFQFVVSIVFISAVLIVQKQMDFIQSKELGYQRDQLMHFEIPFEFDTSKMNAAANFVQNLKTISGVQNTSSYYHNLTGDHGGISDFTWPGKNPDQVVDFANLEVGANFLQTACITLVEGRYFTSTAAAQQEIIFNETAIRQMGLKDPIGKTIRFWGRERQIVGVARDFNFESLYSTIEPCFFQIYPVMPNVLLRLTAGSEKQTIEQIQKAFAGFAPGMPFDYRFLDEDYQAMYEAEQRVSTLSRYFAGLAIIISCLGLFGLAAYTAQKRQKEIGIRKVLGATVGKVALMVSSDFLKLVCIAAVIAFPLSWWLSTKWLSGFAYRIDIGAGIFLIAGGITLVITLLAIGFQSLKAAMANPIRSLRTE